MPQVTASEVAIHEALYYLDNRKVRLLARTARRIATCIVCRSSMSGKTQREAASKLRNHVIYAHGIVG